MRNLQKGFAIMWVILTAAILIVGGGIYYFKDIKHSEINSFLMKIDDADYSISYSPSLFNQVESSIALPPDYKVNHRGIKLLDPKYVSKIGEKKCSPSEAPDVSLVCTSENQPGITFIVLNNSISSITSVFKDFGTPDQVIAGKKFTTSSIGAEGSGAAYYLYSLGSSKTLVIIRNIVENNTFVPNDTVFNQIIATLTVN